MALIKGAGSEIWIDGNRMQSYSVGTRSFSETAPSIEYQLVDGAHPNRVDSGTHDMEASFEFLYNDSHTLLREIAKGNWELDRVTIPLQVGGQTRATDRAARVLNADGLRAFSVSHGKAASDMQRLTLTLLPAENSSARVTTGTIIWSAADPADLPAGEEIDVTPDAGPVTDLGASHTNADLDLVFQFNWAAKEAAVTSWRIKLQHSATENGTYSDVTNAVLSDTAVTDAAAGAYHVGLTNVTTLHRYVRMEVQKTPAAAGTNQSIRIFGFVSLSVNGVAPV